MAPSKCAPPQQCRMRCGQSCLLGCMEQGKEGLQGSQNSALHQWSSATLKQLLSTSFCKREPAFQRCAPADSELAPARQWWASSASSTVTVRPTPPATRPNSERARGRATRPAALLCKQVMQG